MNVDSVKPDSEIMNANTGVYTLKAALRKSMSGTLRGLTEIELENQSQAVYHNLMKEDVYKHAKNVGCYLSMGKGELRTERIVKDLLQRGVKLYTPYIPGPSLDPTPSSSSSMGAMRMLRLYTTRDLEACQLDKWGILDPGLKRRDLEGDVKREDVMDVGVDPLDLILIPGVAFDVDCNRLGRGKAYYDNFLSDYTTTHPRPTLLALALSPQILAAEDKVPITDLDFRLDGVVHPEGVIWGEASTLRDI